jgi:hypothetical protein
MAAIDVGFPAIITQTQKTGKKTGKSAKYTVTSFRRQLPQTGTAATD